MIEVTLAQLIFLILPVIGIAGLLWALLQPSIKHATIGVFGSAGLAVGDIITLGDQRYVVTEVSDFGAGVAKEI